MRRCSNWQESSLVSYDSPGYSVHVRKNTVAKQHSCTGRSESLLYANVVKYIFRRHLSIKLLFMLIHVRQHRWLFAAHKNKVFVSGKESSMLSQKYKTGKDSSILSYMIRPIIWCISLQKGSSNNQIMVVQVELCGTLEDMYQRDDKCYLIPIKRAC